MNKALKRNKKPWKQTRYYRQWVARDFIRRSRACVIASTAIHRINNIRASSRDKAVKSLTVAETAINAHCNIARLFK